MGVDPTGRGEHRRLGVEADPAEVGERGVRRAGPNEVGEEGGDGPGAAPERIGVHVAMAARIDRADEAGLGIGLEFIDQGAVGEVRDAGD